MSEFSVPSRECVAAQFLPQTILRSPVAVLLFGTLEESQQVSCHGPALRELQSFGCPAATTQRARCGPKICFHPLLQHGEGHSGSAVSCFLSFTAACGATRHCHPWLSHSSAALAPFSPSKLLSFIGAAAAMRCLMPVSPTEQAG